MYADFAAAIVGFLCDSAARPCRPVAADQKNKTSCHQQNSDGDRQLLQPALPVGLLKHNFSESLTVRECFSDNFGWTGAFEIRTLQLE
jgi:hypothetical protein